MGQEKWIPTESTVGKLMEKAVPKPPFTAKEGEVPKWKSVHGKIFRLVGDKQGGDKKACYIYVPGIKEFDRATVASKGGEMGATFLQSIIKQCWLDGDNEMRDDLSYILSVSKIVQEIVKVGEGSVEEL